jgi:hypothetical protein
MKGRLLLLALAAGAALSACDDPVRFEAHLDTVTDTLIVPALTGTPVTATSALNTFEHMLVRPTSSQVFDVVFDIDEQGRAILYPVQDVAIGISGARTSFRFHEAEFDELLLAPTQGYADTAIVVERNQLVLVRARNIYCAGQIRSEIFSKLEVLGIDPAQRRLSFRLTVDPNCGFTSLAPGLPER